MYLFRPPVRNARSFPKQCCQRHRDYGAEKQGVSHGTGAIATVVVAILAEIDFHVAAGRFLRASSHTGVPRDEMAFADVRHAVVVAGNLKKMASLEGRHDNFLGTFLFF